MLLLVLGIVVIWLSPLYGMTIGSDSAPTRFDTQVILNDGDRIAGFAALDAGFFFSSSNVTAMFDSFFQVSGDLEFNGGTLSLSQDFKVDNVSTFGPLGNINGNFHTLDLGATVTLLPIPIDENPCRLSFLDDANGADPFNTVDWAFDNVYIGVGTDTFQPNVLIYEFDGATLTQVESVTPPGFSFDINAVRWHPSEYFLAVGIGSAFFGGAELHIYSFDPNTNTLTLEDSDTVPGAVTALAWRPDGNFLVAGTTVNSQEIKLYSVSSMGSLGTPVNVDISPNRDVQLESLDFDSTGDYFAVGLNASAANPTVLVYDFTPSPLGASLNASATTPETVAGLSWNQAVSDIIAVGQTGTSGDRVIAYEHDGGAGTLTSVATISDFSIAVANISWNASGNCLGVGTDTSGGVGQVRSYCFDEAVPTFDFINQFDEADVVGGINWSPNSSFLATGNEADTLSVYRRTLTAEGTFTFTDLYMQLNNKLVLDGASLIFSGLSTIDGQSNTLDLNETSTIIIDSNSSLRLKNINIKGAGLQRISGIDMTSTLTIEDVTWILDSDFTFTQGNLSIVSGNNLHGDNTQFTYQTDGVCAVAAFSALGVDDSVIFSYDPSVASKNLLQFADSTSILRLNGGTLHVSNTGLNLIKGSLVVDQASTIDSDAINNSQAVTFGDGSNQDNNVTISVNPAATLEVKSGIVLYENV